MSSVATESLQERKLLEACLRAAGLPGNLGDAMKSDPNPLLTLHTYIASCLPAVCFQTFRSAPPPGSADDGVLHALRGPSLDQPRTRKVPGYLRGEPLARHVVWRGYDHFLNLVANPIRHSFSFATPSEEALSVLLSHSPLLELGAGTGYWATLLRARGADVLAVDKHAPSTENLANPFHSALVPGSLMEVGDGVAAAAAHPERTLLLMFPFKHMPGAVAWDAEALAAYTGETVIHVGALVWRQPGLERAACELTSDDVYFDAESGDTTSRRFQEALREKWTLVRTVPLPRFPFQADTLTVWKRKGADAALTAADVCEVRAGCVCYLCRAARVKGELCGLPSCGSQSRGAAPLLACVCKLGIAYCSTEHQAEHWRSHKAACKAARAGA